MNWPKLIMLKIRMCKDIQVALFMSAFTLISNATLIAPTLAQETTSLESATENEGRLPEAWHSLPEEKTIKTDTEPADKELEEKLLDRSVSKIMTTQEKALEKVNVRPRKRWQIESVRTRLSVGFDGTIGFSMLSAENAVELRWRPRRKKASSATETDGQALEGNEKESIEALDEKLRENERETTGEEQPGVLFFPQMTEKDLDDQISPLVEAVMSTKKVKNKEKLKRNLRSRAFEFQKMVMGLEEDRGRMTPWWVQSFFAEVTVSADANVMMFARVGGDVRLRFYWYRIRPEDKKSFLLTSAAARTAESAGEKIGLELDARGAALQKFVRNMAQDLMTMDVQNMEKSGFTPKEFRVGIGMSVTGDFSLVRIGGGVSGYLVFERDEWPSDLMELNMKEASTPATGLLERPGEDEIMLLDQYDNRHIEYAKKKGVPFEIVKSLPGSASPVTNSVLYRISRQRFRKGIAETQKMAKYFINRSKGRGRWELFRIKTTHEVSISGEMGLVELDGSAMADIYYDRIE